MILLIILLIYLIIGTICALVANYGAVSNQKEYNYVANDKLLLETLLLIILIWPLTVKLAIELGIKTNGDADKIGKICKDLYEDAEGLN